MELDDICFNTKFTMKGIMYNTLIDLCTLLNILLQKENSIIIYIQSLYYTQNALYRTLLKTKKKNLSNIYL